MRKTILIPTILVIASIVLSSSFPFLFIEKKQIVKKETIQNIQERFDIDMSKLTVYDVFVLQEYIRKVSFNCSDTFKAFVQIIYLDRKEAVPALLNSLTEVSSEELVNSYIHVYCTTCYAFFRGNLHYILDNAVFTQEIFKLLLELKPLTPKK